MGQFPAKSVVTRSEYDCVRSHHRDIASSGYSGNNLSGDSKQWVADRPSLWTPIDVFDKRGAATDDRLGFVHQKRNGMPTKKGVARKRPKHDEPWDKPLPPKPPPKPPKPVDPTDPWGPPDGGAPPPPPEPPDGGPPKRKRRKKTPRRKYAKVAKRKVAKAKVARRKTVKRKTTKRKVARRKTVKRNVAKRKVVRRVKRAVR